jgi:superoxide reductase
MATQKRGIYCCSICGNIVEVVHAGDGELSCCSRPMRLFTENTTDAALEKHVPIVERVDGGINVKVGSVEHPMQAEHYISWIEAIVDGQTYRQHLSPGDPPEAFFPIEAEDVVVREYCNLHGLWKA